MIYPMPEATWPPRPWSEHELEEDANRSLEALNETQKNVAVRRSVYAEYFEEGINLFDELMRRSNNLLNLNGVSFNSDSWLIAIGRFTGGPLISNDDLERIVGYGLGNKTIDPILAQSAAQVILDLLDRARFPWVLESRAPEESELNTARVATASVWATQRTQTGGRNLARDLEVAVKDTLENAGLHRVRRPSGVLPWSLMPGEFCGEGRVNGTNADVIVHLQAHQKALLIECKVSSTQINGTKRLKSVKEAAAVWRTGFGRQVLPIGVISGAFNPTDLKNTQDDGVYLIWEHNLLPLTELVEAYGNA